MSSVVGALAVSATILLGVVVLVVIVSAVAVKRGEAAMHEAEKHGHH